MPAANPTDNFRSFLPRAWIILPACALLLLASLDYFRARHAEHVTSLAREAGRDGVQPGNSLTGYPDGRRELIVPGRNEASFEWIAQTQLMFARHEWRVRQVDYDNAPFGREVHSTSPYRWWLGLVAWFDHLVTGHSLGLAVERAALFADPVLHGLLLVGGTAFVAWRFGAFAAALFAIGTATMFPFSASFVPGAPTSRGLAVILSLSATLVLLAGLSSRSKTGGGHPTGLPARSDYPWFALGGFLGGLAAWVSIKIQLPVTAGLALGAILGAWICRRDPPTGLPAERATEWRIWALSGGVTILLVWLIEYFPDRASTWNLESVHPLYGIAWLGAGEIIARSTSAFNRANSRGFRRDAGWVVLAGAGIAAIPLAMWRLGTWGFLTQDSQWANLSGLPGGPVAANLPAWISRDGGTGAVWATLVPGIFLASSLWFLLRRKSAPEFRLSVSVALGPVLVALGLACWQLSWWTLFDAAVITVAVLVAARWGARGTTPAGRGRTMTATMAAVVATLGLIQLWPAGIRAEEQSITATEAEELIERDLGQWLQKHEDESNAIVYAPPHESATFWFYAGLRSIGTFAPENQAGFGATLMIAGASSTDRVHALLSARGVRYVVIPSWDPFFEEFPRLYLAKQFSGWKSTFVQELRNWNVPPWLRPVPYQMPIVGGFEKQSVRIFEVIDDQTPVLAASRLAEYLVEIGELEAAAASGDQLRKYPADVGAVVARAQVLDARGDATGLAQALGSLHGYLALGSDRALAWDRRVSLAIVLAREGRSDLARDQITRCLAELDEAKLRSLTTGSLFGFEVLVQAFGLKFADPHLQSVALDLLPAGLRSRF